MTDELIEKLMRRIDQLERMIQDNTLSQRIVLNFNEAVAFLNISSSQLYKMTCKRLIPFYKPNGKIIFFKRAELENWMLSKRRMTVTEIKSTAHKHLSP
jgi:excisionase family DNA binding protein